MFYLLGFFWPQSMWDLLSQGGMESTSPALEGEALTTGQSGKSLLRPLVGFP